MLPYRLRPPVYGGKLKQQKDKESFLERAYPYREGGPVERAVKADLNDLWPQFDEKLRELTTDVTTCSINKDGNNQGCDHVPVGTAFRAFKDVFGSAKVSMLHRSGLGFLPQRCDRNAYSQLLYAVCLDLLREAFGAQDVTSSTTVFNRRTAYAVFALYAIYETNPLPQGPTAAGKQEEWLALLPMGLQNRENPKMIYRRAFRCPVRVDAEHFSYLLRLRDCASAACHSCEATRLRMESGSLMSTNDNVVEKSTASMGWKCNLAVAMDLSFVLDRVLSSNMLELCSYNGPCGLEGFAGHQDYTLRAPGLSSVSALPRVCDSAINNSEAASMAQTDDRSNIALATSDGDLSFDFPSQLEEQLQNYMSSRQSIRLPALRSDTSHQAKRIRELLLPLFSQDSESGPSADPVSRLLSKCRGEKEQGVQACQKRIKLRHRHISFGTVAVNDGTGSAASVPMVLGGDSTIDKQSIASSPEHQAPDRPNNENTTYELFLPNSLTDDQHNSLYAAIQSLLDRDESLLIPFCNGDDLTPSQVEEATTNDVSTLENGGVSTAGSSLTGAGRGALQALLVQAQSTVSPSAKGATLNPRFAANAFFELTAKEKEASRNSCSDEDDDSSHVSDLSFNDENDQVSVAASRVGENALQALLATAGLKKRRKTQKTRPTPSRNSPATRKGKRKLSQQFKTTERTQSGNESYKGSNLSTNARLANTSQPAKETKLTPSRDESCDSSSEWSSYCESVDQGRSALDALLAKAARPNGQY